MRSILLLALLAALNTSTVSAGATMSGIGDFIQTQCIFLSPAMTCSVDVFDTELKRKFTFTCDAACDVMAVKLKQFFLDCKVDQIFDSQDEA
ncbi:hypothetical protein CPB97_011391 [Podila verticillata]|nr:hypothetical protein CPB97_011391 [Podila verticillata]